MSEAIVPSARVPGCLDCHKSAPVVSPLQPVYRIHAADNTLRESFSD